MNGLDDNLPLKCDSGRVLITDDEAQIRKLFTTIIGFGLPEIKVDIACNGLEAVKAFQEGRHAVLLMDLRMPEMDGLQAFMAIRDLCRDRKWQMPAVIFCTGYVPPESVTNVVGDGLFHGVLHKPVKSDQVVTAVKTRLSASR